MREKNKNNIFRTRNSDLEKIYQIASQLDKLNKKIETEPTNIFFENISFDENASYIVAESIINYKGKISEIIFRDCSFYGSSLTNILLILTGKTINNDRKTKEIIEQKKLPIRTELKALEFNSNNKMEFSEKDIKLISQIIENNKNLKEFIFFERGNESYENIFDSFLKNNIGKELLTLKITDKKYELEELKSLNKMIYKLENEKLEYLKVGYGHKYKCYKPLKSYNLWEKLTTHEFIKKTFDYFILEQNFKDKTESNLELINKSLVFYLKYFKELKFFKDFKIDLNDYSNRKLYQNLKEEKIINAQIDEYLKNKKDLKFLYQQAIPTTYDLNEENMLYALGFIKYIPYVGDTAAINDLYY